MANRTTNDRNGTVSHQAGTPSANAVVHRQARDDESPLSITVIEALAEVQGISPIDIRQPLYDAIDPDALDQLFTNASDGHVVFTIADHEVTVTADGDVVVRALD